MWLVTFQNRYLSRYLTDGLLIDDFKCVALHWPRVRAKMDYDTDRVCIVG